MIPGVATASPAMSSAWIWLAWLLGPGSWVAAFVFLECSNPDGRYGDLPDMRVACSLFVTHIAAGMLTLVLSSRSGAHRRTGEFWVLVAYWAAWAATFILFEFAEPVAHWVGMTTVVIAIGFPVASLSGIITRGLRQRRTMQPADHGPPASTPPS
jgi:hypothetical protein